MPHSYDVMRICAVAYLSHVYRLRYQIRACEEAIEEVRSRVELVAAGLEPRGQGSHDKVADGIARIIELEQRWADIVEESETEIADARGLCISLGCGTLALWMHHVEGRTWAYIGREVGYSEAHAKRLAHDAVPALYYAMPERWRRDPIPNAIER